MKKLFAVCLVSALGFLGSNAWAGTAGQDTVERLKLSTDVLTAPHGHSRQRHTGRSAGQR
jgi:hypothetical protein